MKNLIAELDHISAYIEELNEPWAINITWRLDKIAQELEEYQGDRPSSSLSKISKKVLEQYYDNMEFLSSNDSKLSSLILGEDDKEAPKVYKNLKKHFGKISRKEAISFITNVLKDNK